MDKDKNKIKKKNLKTFLQLHTSTSNNEKTFPRNNTKYYRNST